MLTITAAVIVFGVSFIICAGWFYASIQEDITSIASRNKREDLGGSIAMGLIYGSLGPIGVLVAWLLTGFAEHGWRLRPKRLQATSANKHYH